MDLLELIEHPPAPIVGAAQLQIWYTLCVGAVIGPSRLPFGTHRSWVIVCHALRAQNSVCFSTAAQLPLDRVVI